MCMYTLNMVQTYSDVTILIKFETYFFFKMRHAKQLLMGSYANFINICFRYNVLQLNEWKFTHLTNVYFRILVIFSEMQNMIWFWFWLIDPTQRKIVFIKRRHFYRLAWPMTMNKSISYFPSHSKSTEKNLLIWHHWRQNFREN